MKTPFLFIFFLLVAGTASAQSQRARDNAVHQAQRGGQSVQMEPAHMILDQFDSLVLSAWSGSLVTEGATKDGIRTIITFTDPTAERTITVPNLSGTLLLTGNSQAITSPVITTGLTASGSASNNFGGSTGAFVTSTGANTLSGDVTIAAGKDITYAAGDGAFDGSLGTGLFKTTTGAATFGGSSNTFTNAITPTGGVAAAGGFSNSARLVHSGGAVARVNTDGTDTTPADTETYIAEVFVPANVTVTGVSVFLGSATEGNIKVGLADSTGAVVATSASTDCSGATVDSYFRVAFTGTYAAKGPATYYVLLLNDSTSNRFNSHTFGDFGASKKTGEVYATGFTTITPPTTFTTAQGPIASLY